MIRVVVPYGDISIKSCLNHSILFEENLSEALRQFVIPHIMSYYRL